MNRKRAFVTGASGFFGANLVRELISREWDVTAFHRESSDLWRLKGLALEFRKGSFFEPESLDASIPEGVDAVFHVAARVGYWRREDPLLERDNVEATRALLAAAIRRKARRFIHTSTTGVYGLPRERADEHFPKEGLKSSIGYLRTKARAELEVLRAVEKGLDAVILNPATIIGPLDRDHWGETLRKIHEGRMPGAPPGSGSFAHSAEVAKAHLRAFELGKNGENYILAGTEASYLEVFQAIESMFGLAPKLKTIHPGLLGVFGWASQALSHFTGKAPMVTPELLALLTADLSYSSAKAETQLGYRPRSLREMLEDCWKSLDPGNGRGFTR